MPMTPLASAFEGHSLSRSLAGSTIAKSISQMDNKSENYTSSRASSNSSPEQASSKNAEPKIAAKGSPASIRSSKLKGDSGIVIGPVGGHGLGPWAEEFEVSPVPQRKFENTIAEKIHVVSVGNPFHQNGAEVRRIKIYEHHKVFNSFDFPFVEAELREKPKKALLAAEEFIKSPNTQRKIVDKIMARATAIKALTAIQNTLIPLYGGWINSSTVEETGITASSDTLYLVEYCIEHGTVYRSLPHLKMPAKSDHIKRHMLKHIGKLIDRLWETHPTTGFTFTMVSPMGSGEYTFYA